jgi:hypothetical protein
MEYLLLRHKFAGDKGSYKVVPVVVNAQDGIAIKKGKHKFLHANFMLPLYNLFSV